TSISSSNGYVRSFSSDPFGHIFIVASYIYRSTDQGASWSKIIDGLSQSDGLSDVWRVPSGEIFATKSDDSGDQYIFHSIDGGRVWSIDSQISGYTKSMSFNNKGGMLMEPWN